MPDPGEYPEHEKLAKVKDRTQAIGEFVFEFLDQRGVELCVFDENCDEFRPLPRRRIEELIAARYEIDADALADEKQRMLDDIVAVSG